MQSAMMEGYAESNPYFMEAYQVPCSVFNTKHHIYKIVKTDMINGAFKQGLKAQIGGYETAQKQSFKLHAGHHDGY